MGELGAVLRGRRLGWFRHVVRRDELEILGKTQLIELPGCCPPGRPGRKICRRNLQEKQALNQDQWQTVINRLTS